ncbi:PREDICTED: uncharacterized protein LOC109327661 [Lupinus angustifolius]|uniref:uncharacterized protein LOC109327661 n=1 Tax=Lupinus angustifolius TaxID=3871 RepID=UPI00092E6459|nr:PREDICTED: uncharacterized protein LOC109327661 [Lupinus angustifolius]
MVESTDLSQDTKAELASMKEQMAEMFQILKALQLEKEKNATTGPQPHSGSRNPSQRPGTSQPQEGHNANTRHQTQPEDYSDDPDYDPHRETTITQRTPEGNNAPNTEKEEEKWSSIEESSKAIKGTICPHLKNAFKMCLVPNVVLPPNFKVLEFEKYNGTTCPKSHLHMYARKMAAYHGNDKLLIHCFQDSLVGAPMSWYIRLEKTQIRSFLDLSNAFVKQYNYNEDASPYRAQLQNMAKKSLESLREYIQRWRGLTSPVLPRLDEEEQLSIFIDTLQSPYYERLMGNVTTNFNDLIKVGEKLEGGIKSVKFFEEGSGSRKKPTFMRKKDAEIYFIAAEPKRFQPQNNNQNSYRAPSRFAQNHIQNQSPTQNRIPTHNPPNQNNNTYQPRQGYTQYPRNNNYYQQERRTLVFDQIPMTYTDLFTYLQRQGMITPIPGKIPENPGPWYNENVNCAYHSGAVRHLVEDCMAFKFNAKRIDFRETRPNITGNPLPNHGNQEVNAIETKSRSQ